MSDAPRLDRRWVVRRLVTRRKRLLVISGLGAPSYDLAAAGDHALNFYLWGAMGNAAMVGLGLALARPADPVLVITGDGEMLMGIGALATIAVQKPRNLSIVVLDNERYGETGNQPTHTAHGVDLSAMARAAGFRSALTARTKAEVNALVRRLYSGTGPVFAAVKVSDAPMPLILPPRDGTLLKHRFRQALLGEQAAQ